MDLCWSSIEHGGTRPISNIMAPLTLFNEAPKHKSVAPLTLQNVYLWLSFIDFVQKHPSFKFARTCLDNVSPHKFWSISNQYPDLVSRLHVQIRLLGNFGFSAELPWASKADDALCFICKESNDNLYHFLFDCPYFRDNFDSLLSNLVIKATNCNSADGSHISSFLTNLDQHNKASMLVGCLPLPYSVTVTVLTRFVASAVGKIYKLRTERLCELEAPWLRKAVK